jgi:hypothetical protein
MGTWGVGLYQCDDASDLRDEFREVVRAPWDGDRLRAWALDAYPDAGDNPDLQLVLADLFWIFGIEQRDVLDSALAVVESGADLESKRRLGMSDRDLQRRATVLDQLAAKWRGANLKPRDRRMLKEPQPFLLEPGACLTYPTAKGRVRNPYVTPARETGYYRLFPWERDGSAAAIVLARVHRYETFARYLVAILRYDADSEPELDIYPTLSILHSRTFTFEARRRVHLVSTTRMHLKRMGVSIVGKLTVNSSRIEQDFADELTHSGGEFANDAWTLPDAFHRQPERFAPADVRDPIAAFLL